MNFGFNPRSDKQTFSFGDGINLFSMLLEKCDNEERVVDFYVKVEGESEIKHEIDDQEDNKQQKKRAADQHADHPGATFTA